MKKILIIGAGPAGLTAALELARENEKAAGPLYDVTVVEASDTFGGISRTVVHGGSRMDIGGHRFFSKDPQVMAWWKELMPLQGEPSFDDRKLGREKPLEAGGPAPDEEDRVMLVRRRVSRIYYLKKFFDYPVSMKWQTFKNMGFFRTVAAGVSYVWSAVFKKKETSLENFYINRFGRVLYGMFFEKYTEKLWGRHPREISADWGAQRVKGLSIMAVVRDMFRKIFGVKGKGKVETSLIEQYWYPKLGPGQLWETAAAEAEARGVKFLRGHEVVKLTGRDGRLTGAVCRTPEGEKSFEADLILSTMPVKDLVADLDGPAVPKDVAAAAAGLPYRDFVTVGLLADRLNLKNETDIPTLGDIVPDCWIYVQEPDVKLGRIQIFNNWSPYMTPDPEHSVWIGLEYFCREGDEFWSMDEKACADFAVSELVSMGILKEGSVRDFHRERVKKAYPAYFDTYSEMDKITAYLDSFDNLYCLGRNGQHRYNNMDHSMVTAFRAVDHITGRISDKSEIWKVNTEKEYHEESKEN